MDIEKLKMDLTTRSNETAVLRDLVDYADDISQARALGIFIDKSRFRHRERLKKRSCNGVRVDRATAKGKSCFICKGCH